jgi:hypothetical protein
MLIGAILGMSISVVHVMLGHYPRFRQIVATVGLPLGSIMLLRVVASQSAVAGSPRSPAATLSWQRSKPFL